MSLISGGISWSPTLLSTSFFQPFIYRRHWKGMFMDEGNTFTSPDLKRSQMPIRVWHGDIESGDWLAGDISSLDNDLTLASRAVRALYTVWAVRLHWGRHEITCPEDFMRIFSFYLLILFKSLGFDLFFLTVRGQKSTWKNYYQERGLKLFSGKTFCNHIKVLVGSPI